jgi:hypothetical protein
LVQDLKPLHVSRWLSQIMDRESHVALHPRALKHGLLHVFTPPSHVVSPAPPVNKD